MSLSVTHFAFCGKPGMLASRASPCPSSEKIARAEATSSWVAGLPRIGNFRWALAPGKSCTPGGASVVNEAPNRFR